MAGQSCSLIVPKYKLSSFRRVKSESQSRDSMQGGGPSMTIFASSDMKILGYISGPDRHLTSKFVLL